VTDDRAVSDTLSFVLVFALVVSGVGLVTVFGMSSLVEVKDGANAEAAERGFVTLAESVDELEATQSPIRTSDISLVDATIGVTAGPSVDVAVGNTSVSETIPLGAIEYRTDETVVSYAGGGVFRTQDGGTAVVSPPSVRCTADHATLSFVRLSAEGSSAVGGGTARVVVTRSETALAFPETREPQSVTNVSITTADPRWQRYLGTQPGWSATGPGAYTCPTDRVFVRTTTVTVDLE
jgi:hypothetical protein